MNLTQLAHFLETAKKNHLGKAADILGLSPGAVHHSIKTLEKNLGRPLFARQGRNIVLTSHGSLLMKKTMKLFTEVESIKEEMESEGAELEGHYKLGATHALCARYLTPSWTHLQNRHPKLKAEIYSLRSAEVVAGVVSGNLDFGLCFNPHSHPVLSSKCIYDGQLVLAVRKGHPLLKYPVKERMKRISQYPAALAKAFQGIESCESHPMFGKFSIHPRGEFIFDSDTVAARHLAGSLSWALLPRFFVESDKRLTGFAPSKGWDAPLHASVIWSKNRILTKAMKQLIARLEKGFIRGPESVSEL